MKPSSYYLAKTLSRLWALAALLLVSMAVFISVLRYSLPYMDQQKSVLEDWLSNEYGAELDIGYISATWKGVGPAIVLKDVKLSTGENSPITLQVEETQVELDFWSSLLSWQIKSKRFNLSQLELTLDLPKLKGDTGNDFPIVDALKGLFLNQLQRFSVSDSRVLVKTQYDDQEIEIQQLSWVNENNRHRGIGQMRVVELASNSASFGLELYGSTDRLTGTFYADAEELDVSPWIQQLATTSKKLTQSRVNLKLWANIEDSHLTSVQARLADSSFRWKGKREVNLNVSDGYFAAQPVDDEWRFNVQKLIVQGNQQPSMEMNWTGALKKEGVVELNTDKLSIASLRPVASIFLNPEQTQALLALNPKGQISLLQLRSQGDDVAMHLTFSGLSTEEWHLMPGISGLQGSFDWQGNSGHLKLQSYDGELASEALLGHRLAYQYWGGDIYVTDSDGFEVVAPELVFEGQDINLQQAIRYSENNLAIVANIARMSVQQAKLFFPPELMGSDTQAYLNRALVEGTIQSAQLLWQGNPQAYPFAQQQGIFQAGVTLEDTTFEFDPGWPALTDTSLQLLFENEGLWISSTSGRLMDLPVGSIQAVIPQLAEEAVLTIDAVTQGSGAAVTALMQASDLADSVGSALQEVQIDDDLQATLNLHIPLSGQDVVAKGDVLFTGNPVTISSLNLQLEDVQGKLSFDNDKITAQGLKGQLFGQPLQFSFEGRDSDKGYLSDIKLAGHWPVEPLLESYHPSLSPHLKGIVNWRGNLALTIPQEGFHYELQLSSDLPQLVSDLPAPFTKAQGEKLRLLVDSEGDDLASSIRILLGNDIKFNGILPHNEMQFSRAHLSLGETDFVGMGTGFSISADLPRADFEPWYQAVDALLTGVSASEGRPLIGAPQRIFFKVDELWLAGQQLTQVEGSAKPTDDSWKVTLTADQTRSNLSFYHDWQNKGLDIKADYLWIQEWQENSESEGMSGISDFPPLTLTCKQCRYKDYDLGQVELALSRSNTGMNIDKLHLQKAGSYLLANGNWYINEQGTSTRLKGNFNSKDMGSLLKELKMETGIRDSSADMQFDLSWHKAPYEFNFASLHGDVDWRLSDGYLTELSDGGARILSILSLESLVRKLKLDFRDVFAKGFFYDRMQGSFQITDGLVDTKDSVINGAAADIRLTGHTNLNDQSLNYRVEVTPKVTSSLPVILAWMVNPATAIAAFAIDEVLTSAKVISNIQYSLTGTLDEPNLTELGRRSKDVQLPARANPSKKTPAGAKPVQPVPEQDNQGGGSANG